MAFKKDEETNRIREFIFIDDEVAHVGINKANISRLDTVISRQQMTAIAFIIRKLFNSKNDTRYNLYEEIENIYNGISENGFVDIYSNIFTVDFNMELPAIHDVLFAISRMTDIIYEDKSTEDK